MVGHPIFGALKGRIFVDQNSISDDKNCCWAHPKIYADKSAGVCKSSPLGRKTGYREN
jgi:hypothetical protein